MKKTAYLVTAIKPMPNRANGGVVYKVEMQDLKTQKFCHTWADPNMKNFRGWQPVIENKHQGQVLTGLEPHPTKPMINADSPVSHLFLGDPNELADIVAEYWSKPDLPGCFEVCS